MARAKTIAQVIYEDHIAGCGDDADQPWLLRLLERTEYEARSAYGDVREPASTEIAAALIENLSKPAAWAETFQSVKYDTDDNANSSLPDRWIVIAAKGEHADRIAALYEGTLIRDDEQVTRARATALIGLLLVADLNADKALVEVIDRALDGDAECVQEVLHYGR